MSEYEAITFDFNESAIATVKEVLKDIAKFDKSANAWVMPAGTWSLFVDRPDLGELIHYAADLPWSEVMPVIELLQSAKIEPRDHMPEYRFVGGSRRFAQVR